EANWAAANSPEVSWSEANWPEPNRLRSSGRDPGGRRPWGLEARGRDLSSDLATAYLNALYGARVNERNMILERDVQMRLSIYDPFHSFFDHCRRLRTDDPMARIRYLDLKTHLTDGLLTRIDRASMAVSLEVRCPLLDHQFLNLMARIPSK